MGVRYLWVMLWLDWCASNQLIRVVEILDLINGGYKFDVGDVTWFVESIRGGFKIFDNILCGV